MAKVKVPKRVAGVKVPKKLRKRAKKALVAVDTDAARDIAIAGIALAMSDWLDRRGSRKTAREVLGEARGGSKRLRAAIADGLDGAQLAEILRAAAAEGARRFLEGFEEAKKAPRPAPARRRAAKPGPGAAAG